MQINNNNSISFKQVYIKSKDAEKLLKKADRAIKASNVTFLDTGIPEGHKKPLWSVLSNVLKLRQETNPNHILIDISDKSNQMLCVKTIDNKGFTTTKVDVSPMPEFGTKNELFPTSNLKSKFYLFIIFIATLFIGIGYASINSISLDISGRSQAKSQDKVFITNIKIFTLCMITSNTCQS